MLNITNKYTQFIRKTKPTEFWKKIRFILHWASLFPKLFITLLWSLCMLIYMMTWKTRKTKTIFNKRSLIARVLNHLPLYTDNGIQLYCCGVPYYSSVDGSNHEITNQVAKHGIYHFLMNHLKISNGEMAKATQLHMYDYRWLARGYRINTLKQLECNFNSPSSSELLGVALATSNSSCELLKETYERLIVTILDNDYSLLDASNKPIKSEKGMFQPGLEVTGKDALTILAALKVAAKSGLTDARHAYDTLIRKYGYGLLSLFPLTFTPWRRNYFNDNNCMIAAYLLTKYAKGKWAKRYWSFVMLYIWALSYKWYNGWFTGLINSVSPGLISETYTTDCKEFLYESDPLHYTNCDGKTIKPDIYPVRLDQIDEGNFLGEAEHRIVLGGERKKTGLGWLAYAIMLDTETVKEVLSGKS